MNDKGKEYSERVKEWRNISVNQISFTNNLVSTLATGYLLYLIDKFPNDRIEFSGLDTIDLKVTLFIVSIVFVLFSVLIGVLILLSRLYDFRITRNIALTRKRIVKKHQELMPDFGIKGKGFFFLIKTIFGKINFIEKSDCDQFSDQLKTKFNNLRIQSRTLGNWTWKLTKFQLLIILIGVTLHIISITY